LDDDAIAQALENNLEIAVTRHNLPIAQTDLLEDQRRKSRITNMTTPW